MKSVNKVYVLASCGSLKVGGNFCISYMLTLMLECKMLNGKAVVGFELSQRRNSGWTSPALRLKRR